MTCSCAHLRRRQADRVVVVLRRRVSKAAISSTAATVHQLAVTTEKPSPSFDPFIGDLL